MGNNLLLIIKNIIVIFLFIVLFVIQCYFKRYICFLEFTVQCNLYINYITIQIIIYNYCMSYYMI